MLANQRHDPNEYDENLQNKEAFAVDWPQMCICSTGQLAIYIYNMAH